MKELIKVMLTIGAFFIFIFLIIKFSGWLTMEQIEGWLAAAKNISPIHVAVIIAALLVIDLLVSVPTMSLTMLSGYFLGGFLGTTAALVGLIISGLLGYSLSRIYGPKVLNFLVKDSQKQQTVIQTFNQHGFIMIVLARAVPMLPEVTSCLAGTTKMPFLKFLLAWLLSAVPYTAIAAYSGSVSSISDPTPAIFTAIGIWGSLWLGWFLFNKKHKK